MTVRQSISRLVIVAAAAAAAVPATAQVYYWNDRPSYPGYYQQPYQAQPPQRRDFFSFPFLGGQRYHPPADYSKAPPPRKLETPATSTVVVVGDSMADWLGHGLDEVYAEQQEDTAVVRDIRAAAGLIRYDAKNETLEWPGAVKDELAVQTPKAIVVMLGLNDRISIRDGGSAAEQAPQDKPAQEKGTAANSAALQPAAGTAAEQRPVPGHAYEFHTDQWADLYVRRIDQMIAALKAKGVPILWVGLPALRGTKSTSDMAYLDELYRERADRAGIYYVDIWDGFVDEQGRYAVDGPDFEGQIRRLRTADGVHFTKAGAVKLASYVDQELRRVLSSKVAPIALPEQGALPKPGAPRPDVGPVVPLTVSNPDAGAAANAAGSGNLLGAGNQPAPTLSDPLAQKVLDRGAPIAAVAGRSDDFAWPRPSAPTDVTPQPVSLTPATPAKKPAAAHDDAKKSDTKKDAKKKPESDSEAAKTRRAPRAELDGAPRPPRAVGGGF